MHILLTTLTLVACNSDDKDGRGRDEPSDTVADTTKSETDTILGDTDTSVTGSVELDPPLMRFVAFGDYGTASAQQLAVSELVDRLDPEFIVTLGDNVYLKEDGHDERIGAYYQEWIYPYNGAYGAGSPDGVNRFWPCLGNHDWDATIEDWYTYFELPGNERYYTKAFGDDADGDGALLELFCVDSDIREPDGNTASSVQGQWLEGALAASSARWKVVVFHHPPWSSALHGPNRRMQWPFAEWGADLVMTGHDHVYERLVRDGQLFVTEGRGGASLYVIKTKIPHSQVAMNSAGGATIVELRLETITLRSWDVEDRVTDQVTMRADHALTPNDPIVRLGAEWRFWDAGSDLGAGWREPSFDDSKWAVGHGQLGFGDLDEAGLVAGGPVGANPTTTYFRHHFDIADPAQWENLEIALMRDDGAVVYLNGREILRDNLPAGPVDSDTLALVDLLPPEEDYAVIAVVPAAGLVAGENLLAVEVHQAGPATKDLSFDLALRGENPERLVALGGTWSYLDTGVAPAADWKLAAEVAGWSTGTAPLGYGHDDLATVVATGDPAQLNATTWFRTTFDVDDPAAIGALLLRVVRDDGAIVWLNGREINRFNLPKGQLGEGTYAAQETPLYWESIFTETFVDTSALVAGTNIIAVEVHQALPAGRNLRFDLELAPVR